MKVQSEYARKRTRRGRCDHDPFSNPFPCIHPPLSTCGGAQRSSWLLKLEPQPAAAGSFEHPGLTSLPWLPGTKRRLHPFVHMAHWSWEQLYMPRSHVKLRKRASWESASNLGHGVDPMRHVRPTTALEKCEEGCGSVTHVTGEPLKMFIGTRAPSSSVSRT